jgi:glycosyltransferase involved in cell wall biosynthesis
MSVRSVLYVVSFSFPGTTGTPLHAMGIAEAMRDKGVEVHVAQLRPHPLWKSQHDNWKGIPVYRLGRPGWQGRLRALIRSLRPDVVHAHHIAAAVFSLGPCRREGVPLVYECHSFWKEETWEAGGRLGAMQRYYAWRERTVFEQSRHVVALSEKMKETHVAEMGVDAAKISVIYPGVRASWIKESCAPAQIPGVGRGDILAMYSGNFAAYQGVELLLQGRCPDAAQGVIFLGRRLYDEMPTLMARADLLLIPRPNSRICWTMPRKFGEYLSAGRPVLATDVGDHRRVIERYHCGIVASCSPEGIADGLVQFAKMLPEARRQMGQRALDAARESFDWDKQMDRFLGLYEAILDQQPPRHAV